MLRYMCTLLVPCFTPYGQKKAIRAIGCKGDGSKQRHTYTTKQRAAGEEAQEKGGRLAKEKQNEKTRQKQNKRSENGGFHQKHTTHEGQFKPPGTRIRARVASASAPHRRKSCFGKKLGESTPTVWPLTKKVETENTTIFTTSRTARRHHGGPNAQEQSPW
jgi:hypothetical protein